MSSLTVLPCHVFSHDDIAICAMEKKLDCIPILEIVINSFS